MTRTTTITINGRLYDAITGMPVVASGKPTSAVRPAAPKPQPQGSMRAFSDIGPRPAVNHQPAQAPKPAGHPMAVVHPVHPAAQAIHSRPQKSQTLYRKALKKPEATPSASITTKELSGRSPLISKFGTNVTIHPDLTRQAQTAKAQDEPAAPPQVHPTVAKILQQQASIQQPAASGKELKEQLIKERLAEVEEAPHKKEKRAWFKSKPRLATILTSTLAILVLGGYITYMNLPVISMKVAASRAGVAATFPNYRPDGYSLNGPITYAPGEVSINYKATTNDNGFRITQKASNWDSQGLLDNYVTKQTENYLTFVERGITVYTFGNKAAWVNGGLLYTLDGSATLSSDQILQLATSM